MDADRVIKVLEILAWPCTAIFFGLLFRSQVAGLIRRINAVEAGGVILPSEHLNDLLAKLRLLAPRLERLQLTGFEKSMMQWAVADM